MKYFKTVILFLLCSSLYASPVRIIGMGSFDLIIEDESNRINLFDYGKNVAGFSDDERGSSVETYITYGNIKNSDSNGTRNPKISYWGVNLPSVDLSALPNIRIVVDALPSIAGIPTGVIFTSRMGKGYAFSGSGAFSSTKIKYESLDEEYRMSRPIGGVIFSRDFGMYAGGVAGGYTKMAFTNDQDNSELYATLKGFNVGGAAHLSPMLDFGINGGIAIPDVGLKYPETSSEVSFKGNAISVGVQSIMKVPGLLKLGARINFLNANLDGKGTEGDSSIEMGEMSETDFDFGSRLLFSSILLPLKVGVNLNYRKSSPVYTDTVSETLFDNSLSITNFGIGVSYAIPLLTPGLQYNLYNTVSTDNLDDEKINSSFWDIRFGGEFDLTPVTLRTGFIIAKDDPDSEIDDNEHKSRSITLGGGIQLPLQPFKFEVAYVNKETKPVDNPTEQKEVDNSIYTAFKMRF